MQNPCKTAHKRNALIIEKRSEMDWGITGTNWGGRCEFDGGYGFVKDASLRSVCHVKHFTCM